ncbi:hypothetical protein [Roseivivax sp. CAU 1761]
MTTRRPIALLALAGIVALVAADLAATGTPDIYGQPPALAWGSGQAAGGAHCAALPD